MEITTNGLIEKGQKFTIQGKTGDINVYFSHIAPNGMAYLKDEHGKGYERAIRKLLGDSADTINFKPTVNFGKVEVSLPSKFDINQRFRFLGSLVRMVLKGSNPSVIITGEGGLGKTYHLNEEIMKLQLKLDQDYIVIKGYSTAKGLYKTLFFNSDKTIVFDDCDEVFQNDVSKNILKAALDSYDKRIVSWISANVDDEIPGSFEFTGRIIFISNLNKNKIDQAVISRSLNIDLSMTAEEKITRMRAILPNVMKNVPLEIREECMDLIAENAPNMRDLNMRSLIKVISIRTSGEDDWRDVAEFMILS